MKSTSSFTLIVTFVCLALVGLALVPLLPVKLNPSRSLPGFSVDFSMPGASSRVVEMEVTGKLEAMLSRMDGVRSISSTSNNGSGNITVRLDKHADIEVARFEAATIIRQAWAGLPDGVSYPVLRVRMSDEGASRPFLSFTLNAPAPPAEIQRYAEEHIKPRIAAIGGVYQVSLSGSTPMEWQLTYDSRQLAELGICVDDVQAAVGASLKCEFLGTHDTDDGRHIRLALMPGQQQDDTLDVSHIGVKSICGKLVRLDELVKVNRVEEEPQSYFRINGLNSIYLSVAADETANQLQLQEEVMRQMEMAKQILPAGYEVHLDYDATEYIRAELHKIYLRTAMTVIILLAFVWLITRRWRYLLLIVCSLAVNIATAVIFYYLLGLEMQLYSLAGITVSLNLVIDSTIVMTDHLLLRRNLKAFLSVLAATLTTVGALVIVFFLDEKIRLNLQDFAAVVIVNLCVSLAVSLFFVPSLVERLHFTRRVRHAGGRRFLRRLPVWLTHVYARLISVQCRFRWAVCLLWLLAFGLPVFMLPDKVEGDGRWSDLYNHTLGSDFYRHEVKPWADKALGGTLRLFVQKVYEGSYFTTPEEVVLTANANLPNGSTLEQMNYLIKRMESYLTEFDEIRQFHTSIYNARRASINIYFKKKAQRSGFPYLLKASLVSKALELGGGSWNIYGLQDQGFSNDVRETAGSYQVKMYGYNYDELYAHAEAFKQKLLQHRRIKEVSINSEFSWWKDDYQEFYLTLDRERMGLETMDAKQLFAAVSPIFGRSIEAGRFMTGQGTERIRLTSRQAQAYDVWAMQYVPMPMKLGECATLEKRQMPPKIAKENQQYRLCLQYEYIGSAKMGHDLLVRDLEDFNSTLPMGYTAMEELPQWGWDTKDYRPYLLLCVVIGIIFFVTAILFNSLRQPLAILFVIPVSYIGVFATFYLFRLNFDQGGYAAFVLLCGITVNASIYVLNEYNAIRRRLPRLSPMRAYLKAWNVKVTPIFLTVVSTIIGFIPFMVGTEHEAFWFPLAAGTIGGLVMSLAGIFFLLPVFVLGKYRKGLLHI